MTSVSVVVPYRGDNGGARDQAWDYVQQWWAREYPDWQVVCGYIDPGPWIKARAVADGLCDATGDIIVLADADVICYGVGVAVDALTHGRCTWAVPHYRVHRLSCWATTGLYAGQPLPPDPGPRGYFHRVPGVNPVVDESHRGMLGGGMVVMPRELYGRVPLDNRFIGWGQEDSAFGIALGTMAGQPIRGVAALWHLWHEPQQRVTRTIGSKESLALHQRYQRANGSPELMNAILAEMQV